MIGSLFARGWKGSESGALFVRGWRDEAATIESIQIDAAGLPSRTRNDDHEILTLVMGFLKTL